MKYADKFGLFNRYSLANDSTMTEDKEFRELLK
jgi:hypothetical protein